MRRILLPQRGHPDLLLVHRRLRKCLHPWEPCARCAPFAGVSRVLRRSGAALAPGALPQSGSLRGERHLQCALLRGADTSHGRVAFGAAAVQSQLPLASVVGTALGKTDATGRMCPCCPPAAVVADILVCFSLTELFFRPLRLLHDGGEGCRRSRWRRLKVQIEGLRPVSTAMKVRCAILPYSLDYIYSCDHAQSFERRPLALLLFIELNMLCDHKHVVHLNTLDREACKAF